MFRCREEKDVWILELVKPNDSDSQLAEVLRAELRRAFQKGKKKIIVDFGGRESASSVLLSVLVVAQNMAAKQGGQLFLCNVASLFEEIVHITQLDRFLKIYPSWEKAMEEIQKREKE